MVNVKETLHLWVDCPLGLYKAYFRHGKTKQEIPFSNQIWDEISCIIHELDKLNKTIPGIYDKMTGLKLDNYNGKLIIYCNDELYAYLSINNLFDNDSMEVRYDRNNLLYPIRSIIDMD